MSEGIELRPIGKSAPPPPPRHPHAPSTLTQGYRAAEARAKAAVHLQDGNLDQVSYFGLALGGWFTLLSLPLLLFPRLLVFLAQPSATVAAAGIDRAHRDDLTALESLLVALVSLGLLALALVALFVLVPTYTALPGAPAPAAASGSAGKSAANAAAAAAAAAAADAPPPPPPVTAARTPVLIVLTALATLAAVVGWNARVGGGLAVVVGLGNAAAAIWGWWVIVFGTERVRVGTKRRKDARYKHL